MFNVHTMWYIDGEGVEKGVDVRQKVSDGGLKGRDFTGTVLNL